MSKIAEYTKLKLEVADAKAWAALIGSEYRGGGGGVGKLTSLSIKATAYHQQYDGATNYHDAPGPLSIALGLAAGRQFSSLLDSALAQMEIALSEAAKAAHAEHSDLMNAAGLVGQAAA